MDLKNKNTILKFIIFLIFLSLSVCLFVFIQKNSKSETNNLLVVIVYIALIISGFSLFILGVLSSKALDSNLITNEEEKEDATEEETEKENSQEKEEEINRKDLIEKIIPKTSEEKDLVKYTGVLLTNFAKEFEFVQGIFFIKDKKKNLFNYCCDYAYFSEEKPSGFITGETLPGQVAKNKKLIYLSDIPDDYIKILSGLGESSPNYLLIAPIVHKNNVIGVIELASFIDIKPTIIEAIEEIANKSGEQIIKLI